MNLEDSYLENFLRVTQANLANKCQRVNTATAAIRAGLWVEWNGFGWNSAFCVFPEQKYKPQEMNIFHAAAARIYESNNFSDATWKMFLYPKVNSFRSTNL